MSERKIVFSGIQPSGAMQLGNYLGAIRNWGEMQKSCDCIYSIVDLHAITVRQVPADLRRRTKEGLALLLSCGIDPERSLVFVQSHVPAHSELAWVLGCYAQFGELSRMTQFKDKSKQHADNINGGLFTYPVLMAADILLYNTDLVPIGQDQKQHVELARNIAVRFNGVYSPTFTVPEPYIPKEGAKIASLAEPVKKMSKSEANENATIYILDSRDAIIRKFRRAVTDSDNEIAHRPGKDGINNLLTIYAAATGCTVAAAENQWKGAGYGAFKEAVGEAVADMLEPFQRRYAEILADSAYIDSVCRAGAEKAAHIADKMLQKVYRKVGFYSPK